MPLLRYLGNIFQDDPSKGRQFFRSQLNMGRLTIVLHVLIIYFIVDHWDILLKKDSTNQSGSENFIFTLATINQSTDNLFSAANTRPEPPSISVKNCGGSS